MKQILEKQAKHLEEIKKVVKRDNVIQLNQVSLQAKTDKDLNEDQKQTNDRLEKINKTLEDGLKGESSKSLNSNVIKLFKEVQKQSKILNKLSPEQAQRVTDKALKAPQFKQIGERFEGFVKGFKDFFSLKGFLNKTGVVSRDSQGILATAVNKRAARMEFVEDRMKMDRDKLWNLRGGKKLEESLQKGDITQKEFDKKKKELEDGMRESFSKIFDDTQDIMRKMRKNEAEIERMEKGGFTEQQIKRSGVYDTRADLAKQLSERDTRFKVEEEKETSKKSALKVAIDDEKQTASAVSSFSDEAQLEANRLQEKQVGLLEKIAENTEYLKNLGGGGMAKRASGEGQGGEEGIGGFGSSLAGIAAGAAGLLTKGKSIGKAILRGGKALGTGIMNVAKAPLTGVAKFAAPLAAGMSVGEGVSDLLEGKKVEQISDIVPEGWNKLNPFSWAMRGGMYTGEKINQGYGSLSEKLGGTGSLGGDVFEGVQKIKGFGENIGEKASAAFTGMKDFLGYDKGISGTLSAQNMNDEVAKRMKAENVQFGSDRANQIREEVRKEILAKDPNAFKTSEQMVSSNTAITDQQKIAGGMTTTTAAMTEGITTNKSLLGSEFLGSLVSKKGLETGTFVGSQNDTKTVESATDSAMSGADNTTNKFSQMVGKRISGGLFGSDTYKITTGDGQETEVSKDKYMKMQEMISNGDQKGAFAMLSDIRKRSAEAKMFEGAYDISKSPEETLTPPSVKAISSNAMVQSTALDASANNVKLADQVSKEKIQPIVVSSPTTNVSNNRQNVVVPTPIRNQDSSFGSYVNKRAVFA